MPSGYSNTYQIFQTPGLVAIYDEEIHHVRMIPLDGRPHLTDKIRHWNGDSRGHWEGNTLVVDTTNFNDKTDLRYRGSSNTHAVERFTRISPDMIDYKFTITDPSVFTQPFTVAIPMPRRDDKIFEYAATGNHSMVGILAGARRREGRRQRGSRPWKVVQQPDDFRGGRRHHALALDVTFVGQAQTSRLPRSADGHRS